VVGDVEWNGLKEELFFCHFPAHRRLGSSARRDKISRKERIEGAAKGG
jgi:hypothetical protein